MTIIAPFILFIYNFCSANVPQTEMPQCIEQMQVCVSEGVHFLDCAEYWEE